MKYALNLKKTEHLGRDVIQKKFDIVVAGETVPCVMWEPASGVKLRTLIAMGHGGGQHKTTCSIRNRALRYARDFGWASLAIDAPKHGARISREEKEVERLTTQARVNGVANAPSMSTQDKITLLNALAAQAVPEWQAALDSVLERFALDLVSMGYWHLSPGTWIGIPLLAVETRFCCAVLGLSQWHPDQSAIRDRDYAIALFNAFGSADKSMHINPGGHGDIPPSEVDSWDGFSNGI
jgi:hypothetical protein